MRFSVVFFILQVEMDHRFLSLALTLLLMSSSEAADGNGSKFTWFTDRPLENDTIDVPSPVPSPAETATDLKQGINDPRE